MGGIVVALILTFIIAGIWHGAAWIFIVWGLLQGIFLSVEALTNKRRKQFVMKHSLDKKTWYIFLSTVFTYFLFAFSEIFGGAVSTIEEAFFVLKKIITNFNGPIFYDHPSMLFFLFIGIGSLFLVEWKNEFYKGQFSFFNNKNWMIRSLSYTYLIILILLIGVFDGGQFIYFKF